MALPLTLADSLGFLRDLAANNNRDWFDANRTRYERELREPAMEFISAVGAQLAEFSPHLVADERKSGGSLMRIFRDTRFGADKTPYKTNVGIRFAHADKGDVHAPGLYVHLALDECFLGAGAWRPEPEPLAAIRNAIADQPARWSAALAEPGFKADWRLGGESLKRVPRGFDASLAVADDLKRRDFIAIADLPRDWLGRSDLAALVMKRFAGARELTRFLTEAVGAEF